MRGLWRTFLVAATPRSGETFTSEAPDRKRVGGWYRTYRQATEGGEEQLTMSWRSREAADKAAKQAVGSAATALSGSPTWKDEC